MKKDDIRYQTYVNILKEELIPAFGCTEPIALAYAAAKARQTLGALPDRVLLQVSGSIIKNVKSVIVPNTGHLKGMPAAAAAGIIAGDPDRELEVISQVPEEKIKEIRAFLENVRIDVEHIDNGHVFDIIVTEYKAGHSARVRILDTHTDIVLIEKDGTTLYEKPVLIKGRDRLVGDRVILHPKSGKVEIIKGKITTLGGLDKAAKDSGISAPGQEEKASSGSLPGGEGAAAQ